MSKRGDPWFKFYPRDWLDGTRELSPEQRGLLISLLNWVWLTQEEPPEDISRIAHDLEINPRKIRALWTSSARKAFDALRNERYFSKGDHYA